MGYIGGMDRQQQVLFPETMDEYVSEENPVRFIDAFVSRLEMAKLGFARALPATEGRPSYDPRDLLRLYIYAYLNRTRSSRRLEQETHRNLEVIWLLRKLRPDHKTISIFRREHAEGLKKVCREFTLLCKRLELFGAELAFVDGSKFRAVNNKDRNFTQPRLKKLLKLIDEQIAGYLAELEAQDRQEEGQPGATEAGLRAKLEALEERKKKYEGHQAYLQANGQSQLSLTDPESRRMKTRGDIDVCYNAQIAVDSKHHLIVAHDVTDQVNDVEQLAPMAAAAKEALEVETLEVAADKGYHNGAHVVACEANGITPLVPAPKTSKNKKRGRFTKERFAYSGERDAYRCPAGAWLSACTQTTQKGRKLVYYANWSACDGCPLRAQCTKSEQGRRIMRTPEEERVEAMRRRVAARPELMLQRKSTVEHPFGTMKRAWDGSYFLLKGLRKVRGEFSLAVLAYNLRRVLNLLGVKCLLEALETGKVPPLRPARASDGGSARGLAPFLCLIRRLRSVSAFGAHDISVSPPINGGSRGFDPVWARPRGNSSVRK
jgi:transposase